MNPESVLDLFRRSGALLDGHFRLTSGLHSDRYLQCALVLQYPDLAEQLGAALGGQVGGQQAARDGDRNAPAGRRIPAGDLLGAPHRRAGRQLQPSDLERRTGPEQAGVPQTRQERVGKLSPALGLGAFLRGRSK